MSREIELVGGPLDGQQVAIPDGADDYWFCALDESLPWPKDFDPNARVRILHGRYTRRPLTVTTYDWQGYD